MISPSIGPAIDPAIALDALLSGQIYAYLLVVARVGAALMVLPGIGEQFVPMRVRLILVLVISWPIALIAPGLPASAPEQPAQMAGDLSVEIFAGLMLGIGARILFSALRTAAQIAGQSIALSNVFAAPGTGMDAGSVLATWMTIAGLAIWFATGLHLLAIDAVAASYTALPPRGPVDLGASAEAVTHTVVNAFALGVQLGAPFMILGFIGYFALGLVNRLMQQLPVFFIVMPLGILGGIWLFAMVAGASLLVFAGIAESWLQAPYAR